MKHYNHKCMGTNICLSSHPNLWAEWETPLHIFNEQHNQRVNPEALWATCGLGEKFSLVGIGAIFSSGI